MCLEAHLISLFSSNGALSLQARNILNKKGKLYIVEMIIKEDNANGALLDLHFMISTGGKERRLQEYITLLKQTGFELLGLRQLPTVPSILIAVPR